jgi:hypothetical protein
MVVDLRHRVVALDLELNLNIIIERRIQPYARRFWPYLFVGEAELVLQHRLPVSQGLHLICQGVEGVHQGLGEVLKIHPTTSTGRRDFLSSGGTRQLTTVRRFGSQSLREVDM